jgi:maltose alpha-D-glucosyltransferase/alpha-amylase
VTLQPHLSADTAWYKDAVIYELHVRSYFDSNGDGIGDLPGLVSKLDYIRDLGVNTIWLLPFYPSPLKDDGYDISNYRDINPAYGTLDDFRRLLTEAHARGLRVFTELVVNHTSDQHPWFQAARQAPPGSPERSYYVWSDTGQEYSGTRVIFTDTEASNWTWDPIAKQYFWHRFFSHQPDLNYDNPQVLAAIIDAMHFWLDMGVDGLRLDAVPYLVEREGTNCENLPATHDILKKLRGSLDARYRDRVLLAEANQWPADVRPYFGDGDECHMAYHFPLMPRIFMAVRQEDALPIVEIMRQTPEIPPNCQWALFLRNHDELTLEMVTDEERDYMYSAYAADPQMRLNVGIRRRLAPLMDHSRPLLELLHSLLLSMPGSPIIYYGDEIGMGDNVYLGDRNGVRTPMQWTGDRNAGFSRADPARLFAPPVMDPLYGYASVNVEAQERSPSSLLNWMRRMLTLRRQHPTLGRGSFEPVATDNRRVLGYLREDAQQQILVVANMARTVQPVHLDLQRFQGRHPVELIGNTELPQVTADPYFLTLAPHGFFWFQLSQVAKPVVLQRPRLQGRDEPIPKLLVSAVWTTLLDGHTRTLLERDALLGFLARQRWFAGKARAAKRARFADWGLVDSASPMFLCLVEVEYDTGPIDRYTLVLATASGEAADQIEQHQHGTILARLSGARRGVLYDGMTDASVANRVMELIQRAGVFSMRSGTLHVNMSETAPVPLTADEGPKRVHIPLVEQSNSSVLVGDRYFLKVFRRLQLGENPEIEVSRTLGARANDARVPSIIAWANYHAEGVLPISIAMVQQQIASRGSAWQRALDQVDVFCERALLASRGRSDGGHIVIPDASEVEDAMGAYRVTIALLGQRTADLHRTMATIQGDGFGVLAFTSDDLVKLVNDVKAHAVRALELARERRDRLPADVAAQIDRLVTASPAINEAIDRVLTIEEAGRRIRTHSDFHLGQVLEVDGDVFFIDFEGEPARPIAERRVPQSPLRDVAGMIRSFGYAARAGLRTFLEAYPDARPLLEPWITGWEAQAGAIFLRTYAASIADTALLPRGESGELLLRALLLDKAFYELSYELNNRPDWVDIPLDGLLRLIEPTI